MATLELTVWEFVRVMVALEDEGADCPFYTARSEVWDAVDGELGRLADEDPDGFAEMMMEHQVTFEDVTAAEMNDVERGAEIALEAIKQAEADGGHDEETAQGLAYEKRELKALIKRLRRSGGGKSGGKAKKHAAKKKQTATKPGKS
jgi:hypothetical protein